MDEGSLCKSLKFVNVNSVKLDNSENESGNLEMVGLS